MAKDFSRFVKRNRTVDDFTGQVITTILKIPKGRVATYGQIAELAGKPNRSRQVGFILRTVVRVNAVPWQRVIGANGRIAFPKRNKNFKVQRRLLEAEGVVFSGQAIDLDRYRWRRAAKNRRGQTQPRMFSW